jgi:hypothetical protein
MPNRSMKQTLFILLWYCLPVFSKAQQPDTAALRPVKDSVVKKAAPQPRIAIAPNPVSSRCELKLFHFEPGMVQVRISSMNGSVVYNEKRLVSGTPDQLLLFLRLPAGGYVCTVAQAGRLAKLRFLVAP